MTTPIFRPARIAAAVAALFALGAGQAHGAAFALQENSGSGLGNAFAGGAAFTEDVSGMWSNPATLSKRMSMEAAGALHIITPSIKFQDSGSVAALGQPLGGNGGDAGSTAAVPNMYFAVPINRQWVFGIGINAPFGLKTEYDGDWIGRFQAVKSEVKTINVNPAISWQATPNFAIGLGVNWQRVDAEFTNKVNYSAAIAQAAGQAAAGGQIPPALVPTIIGATPGLESSAKVDGDDSAWGWNIGVLWDLNPNTRVGASYRSEIKYDVRGNASFENPTVTVPPALAPVLGVLTGAINSTRLYNGGISADIKLPAIANVSFFSRLNDRWDVMADLQWTGWSSIKALTFVRTDGTGVLSSTPENFDDSWRASVGANYRHSDRWMFRGGIAFDQSPVNNTDRTARLPDADRWWFSAGAQYKWNPNLKLDAGFTYITAKDASISQNAGSTAGNALQQGSYDASVTIFSLQGTYTF
ncbi:MAG TPA: outer membrane protein transport protein [Casimicrobiaceae bacterium]|jgi:long-chain fatty acid transport protein